MTEVQEEFDGEKSVVFTGYDKEQVKIHPWVRGRPEVYVSIEDTELLNAVIDREDFVEGILAVFPELTRAAPDEGASLSELLHEVDVISSDLANAIGKTVFK